MALLAAHTGMQVPRSWIVLGMSVLVVVLAAGEIGATERFRGVVLLPATGSYLVVRDVDVAEVPPAQSSAGDSKSKGKAKASPAAGPTGATLKKGDEVEAFGKASAWIAVKRDGKPLGFVPADTLAPLLDGAIETPVTGTVSANGYTCRYVIRFEGRTEIEMGPGRIADYDAAFTCDKAFSHITFGAPMFMSEMPHQGGIKPVYQIALDIIGATPDPDQAFSTILFYDRDKGEVALETAFPAEWLIKNKPRPRRAADVSAALAVAAEMALIAWTSKAWDALGKGAR